RVEHLRSVGTSIVDEVRFALLCVLLVACGSSSSTETQSGPPLCSNDAASLDAGAGDRADDTSEEIESDVSDARAGGIDADGADAFAFDTSEAQDAGPVDGTTEGGAPMCATPPPDQRVLEVAVGGARSCAVLIGGALKCWGTDGSFLGLG